MVTSLHFQVDGFRILYISLTVLLWTLSTVFSADYFGRAGGTRRYHLFSALTLASTVCVFLSADLLTMFIFFEIMSIASYPMVAHEKTPKALRAAETYLAVSLIGGMATLMGLFMLNSLAGTLEIARLKDACAAVAGKPGLYVAGALVITGFGAKAGIFPLHFWLPKAHPAAPAPASALLSGILTKCGVFGVILISCEVFRADADWGIALLIIGVATMLIGAATALFSVDMKKLLACSSVSQIGFITTGIAMQNILAEHGGLAVRGTILHMVNHSLFKIVLFIVAGVVYKGKHSVDLNDIRGFARGKPVFAATFLTAAAGIAGLPLFSGYISKTLLHESILEGIHTLPQGQAAHGILQAAEILFIIAGGMTVAYMSKLATALFSAGPEYDGAKRMKPATAAALIVPAVIILASGVVHALPDAIAGAAEGFMHGHPPEHSVAYFDPGNLSGAAYSLIIGCAMYFLLIRKLLMKKDADGASRFIMPAFKLPDLEDAVYRPVIAAFTSIGAFVSRIAESLMDRFIIPSAIALGAFFARVAEVLLDALVSALKKTLLRPFKRSKFPGRFFGKYYSFVRREAGRQAPEQVARSGFSVSLLLLGLGLSAMLIYALVVIIAHS
ncbi:MAG: sodium:proton antiporter [Oscillospiraceae bacterium]|nr:sodium:proton antiporter [Oscillospiraceae bacterium]